MIASIKKFSKSILAKILVALIALPFILWGMGDVFRSGNQNVIAEINETKISTKEFMNYLQAINLTQNEIKEKGKEKLINEILTNYLSEKIISLETKEKGIKLTDGSLKKILTNDENFKKNGKFSRTKYEKFLLSNGFAAPDYEKNIFNLETKGQLLSYYSGGIKLPSFLINELYLSENKSKDISFIDLEKVYSQKEITKKEINEFYEKNKEFFKDKFIDFKYIELTPEVVTGKNDFSEIYFNKIDEIENRILDGENFEELSLVNIKKIKNVTSTNSKSLNKIGEELKVNKKLLNEAFKIQKINTPSLVEFDNQFFIVEITKEEKSVLDINNKNVKETITNQLNILNLIKENTSLNIKINENKFDEKEMIELSNKYNVPIQKANIKNINDSSKFNKVLLKQIYSYSSGQIFTVTDYPVAKKNFLVKINSEVEPTIKPGSKIYNQYEKKANARYISKVYKSYDKYINAIYKIDINEKVLQRLINSI